MWMMLAKLGLPDSWLKVCQAFYKHNVHYLDNDGKIDFEEFQRFILKLG